MLKTIVFNGGLGNQMFQYAFYLRLKKRHPLSIYCFDIAQAQNCHNGYELDKIFHTHSYRKARRFRRVERHCPKLLRRFYVVKQKNSLEYDSSLFVSCRLLTSYVGFWQSEKYFQSVSGKVGEAFAFNEKMLNAKTIEFATFLKGSDAVSVHVRRGDYLQESDERGLCSLSYYKTAITYIKESIESPVFVFFSDDINWVKDNIPCDRAEYVIWNQGEDGWQDMYLMSCCKHNIIANSSFSWWGAWLNPNKEKTVIAPRQWFINSDNYDILPEQWIKL